LLYADGIHDDFRSSCDRNSRTSAIGNRAQNQQPFSRRHRPGMDPGSGPAVGQQRYGMKIAAMASCWSGPRRHAGTLYRYAALAWTHITCCLWRLLPLSASLTFPHPPSGRDPETPGTRRTRNCGRYQSGHSSAPGHPRPARPKAGTTRCWATRT
jgi:hypothetical protein